MALLTIILPGCDQFPKPPPLEYMYGVDVKNQKCIQCKVLDLKEMVVDCEENPAKQLPLSGCDGLIGVPSGYIVKLRHYQKDADDYAKEHCK